MDSHSRSEGPPDAGAQFQRRLAGQRLAQQQFGHFDVRRQLCARPLTHSEATTVEIRDQAGDIEFAFSESVQRRLIRHLRHSLTVRLSESIRCLYILPISPKQPVEILTRVR